MNDKQYKVLGIIMGLLLLASMLPVGREAARCLAELKNGGETGLEVMGSSTKEELCVVIDPGHGGADPGKVGQDEILEKEINLQIAERLKVYLEANDIRVVMTRTEDVMLEQPGSGNTKKLQDMNGRVQIIEEVQPQLVVSIHQNSYPDASVHGAQVFYFQGSSAGSALAEKIQSAMVTYVDGENKRQIKSDNTYYLLKHVSVPMVIVECGFLTNPDEAQKLTGQEYQDRVAWAIHMGVLQFLAEDV